MFKSFRKIIVSNNNCVVKILAEFLMSVIDINQCQQYILNSEIILEKNNCAEKIVTILNVSNKIST